MLEFDRFVSDASPRLLRLAVVLTGDQGEAEDLAQETFIRVHTRWRHVVSAQNVDAYVNRVMVNCHLASKRKRRVATARLTGDVDSPGRDQLDVIAERDIIREALRGLPVRQRTALVLRFYEELETQEIASVMDISESSVRSAISRGMNELRSMIQSSNNRMETRNGIV